MITTSFHRTFLFLAGLLLSLHSLVPHVHGSSYAAPGETVALQAPSLNSDWLALLQDFFTESDLGEDHLEHFSPGQDLAYDLGIVSLLPPTALPAITLVPRPTSAVIRRQRVFRSRHFPPAGVYPDADAPRGPPTVA